MYSLTFNLKLHNKYKFNFSVEYSGVYSFYFYASYIHDILKHTINYIQGARRWRFKTGTPFDKIWLRESLHEIFNGIIVEAKITLKAMMDFVLFIDNLINYNKTFYENNSSHDSINYLVNSVEEWMIEYRYIETIPEEYEYLFRWFNWWAESEYNKSNTNGYQAVLNILNNMIKYFEKRWGDRLVDYVNNIDKSIVTKLRGKMHGTLGDSVSKLTLKEECGIDNFDLKFLLDTEETI